MANPTSNFGWQMPTSTDLVTDLPADFETFGQAVDSSLADLKGGTSGQVLSKNSNTDMDFVWVTSDDANAIQNTIVDAKGDLIAASASDTPARLAVGSNGETLVADSSTSTGLRYTPATVMSNPVLNSAFQIWQRGTSFATGSINFFADRWQSARSGQVAGLTISRQATNDTTNLPFIQYCARIQRDSGNTSVAENIICQNFESVNSIPFAGKTVTMSFYARAGANYSPTSSFLQAYLYSGTGTDQNNLSGSYTGNVTVIGQNVTLTTTWQRFTITASLAATATELSIQFKSAVTGTAGANDWYEITGLQLDVGSVALPFRTNGGTIQGELAACKRYLPSTNVGSSGQSTLAGQAYGTNSSVFVVPFDVQPRVNPTGVTQVGAINALALNTATSVTVTFDNAGTHSGSVLASHTVTAGQAVRATIQVGGYLLWTGCEL